MLRARGPSRQHSPRHAAHAKSLSRSSIMQSLSQNAKVEMRSFDEVQSLTLLESCTAPGTNPPHCTYSNVTAQTMADAPPPKYDLIIRNARVIDPASDVDAVGDVAVLDGVIVSGVSLMS